MPTPNNPFAKIAKKLEGLQVKAAKLNDEIKDLSSIVNAESKKAATAAVAPKAPVKKLAAKAPAKKAEAKKPASAPKK